MPRVTPVAKAQQRYETVPVLDETGQPKRVPVIDKSTGEQKMTRAKNGRPARPIFMTLTVQDKTKPLPPEECDFCHQPIEIGTPYKWIQPKTSASSGAKRSRHKDCPTWQPWDYSNSLAAQLARIEHDFTESIDSAEGPDDATTALNEAAESVREIAEEKKSGADNMESEFGWSTTVSDELRETGEALETWADEIDQADIPELPEPAERYFIEGPDGTRHGDDNGYEDEDDARDALTGMLEDLIEGTETTEDDFEIVPDVPDEPSDDELNDWRDEVRDSVTIVSEPPV